MIRMSKIAFAQRTPIDAQKRRQTAAAVVFAQISRRPTRVVRLLYTQIDLSYETRCLFCASNLGEQRSECRMGFVALVAAVPRQRNEYCELRVTAGAAIGVQSDNKLA